ncbi:unnamed protein product [Camellia sinensis]
MKQYSLHINCGVARTTTGNIIYAADEDAGSPAEFLSVSLNWGTSTTGLFWDTNENGICVATNKSIITMDESQFLANGKYTAVTLHFAEIIFINNQSFQSLGRRIFDVYIQDVLVLPDFNIENVAHGVNKAVVQKFNTLVKNNTIEIHFYWAGKATRAVPTKGNYGPLISAISVESNFKPPLEKKTKIFIIIGVVALLLCLVFIFLFTFWWQGRSRSNTSRKQDLRGLELQTGLFTFRQIQDANNNFDEANKIGEGGFGSVYKGVLLDGTAIALCPEECQLELDWPTRVRICIGIARGLAFLHEESRLKIVHRYIKATNILLDMNLNPKISDFGLAKLDEDENTHISTRIAGTMYSLYKKKGNLVELMDPKLGSNFNEEEAIKIIKVALSCTNPSSVVRPTMSAVVRILEGDICVEELMMDQSEYGDDLRFESFRDKYYELQRQN